MRSRLMALQAVAFLGSTPIGGPITGFIADTFSAEWSLAYGSVVAVVCAVVATGYLHLRPLTTREVRTPERSVV
jgi:MFS family permease